ncbi:neutral zinc metallopeptidase [Streptomyces sp. SD15]
MRRRNRLGTWCTGLLSTVALLTASAVTSPTGASATTQPPTPTDPLESAQGIRTDTPEGLAEYLGLAYASVDGYWRDVFKEQGLTGPSSFYTAPIPGEEGFSSHCTDEPVVHDTPSFFYCPWDVYTDDEGVTYSGAIHVPVTTARAVGNRTGDFALATVMAHEYGHDVQRELMDQLNLRDIVQMKDGAPVLEDGDTVNVKEAELIADCFSGNWTKYVSQQGLVATADLSEAVNALELAGDKEIGGAHPHGSKQERTTAFTLGYDSGDLMECARQYWVTERWE